MENLALVLFGIFLLILIILDIAMIVSLLSAYAGPKLHLDRW